MYFLEYTWELFDHGIIFDAEIDTDEIGWKEGDHFELVKVDGRSRLIKIKKPIGKRDGN